MTKLDLEGKATIIPSIFEPLEGLVDWSPWDLFGDSELATSVHRYRLTGAA